MEKLNSDQDKLIFFTSTISIVLVPFLISLGIWNHSSSLIPISHGLVLTIFWILILFFQIKEVDTSHWGIVTFFGRIIYIFKPDTGFAFVIWPFKFVKVTSLTLDLHCPGRREEVFFDDDKKKLPPGMKRAIRIPTASPSVAEFKTDAEKKYSGFFEEFELIIGIIWFMRIRINNPRNLFKRIVNIKKYMNVMEKEAEKFLEEKILDHLRPVSEFVLKSVFGKSTAAQVIVGSANISREIEEVLLQMMKPGDPELAWGITGENFQILTPDLSHKLSTALRDVTAAKMKKASEIIQAEADMKARKLRDTGRALGLKRIAQELNMKEKEVAYKFDVIGEALKNNKSMIVAAPMIDELFGKMKSIGLIPK